MNIGIVKWFNEEKGFGLIGTPDNGEYFLHINNFSIRPEKILKGTALIFSEKFERDKKAAKNCKPISTLEDWYFAMSYLGKNDTISIEKEMLVTIRFRTYTEIETHDYSLIALVTNQFFKTKTEDEIKNIFKKFFDEKLDDSLFVKYCDFVEDRANKILKKENAPYFLAEIFEYFGSKLNETKLFQVWKEKKFKYIGKLTHDDYEISKSIIESNLSSISIAELSRIKEYEYGNEFCVELIKSDISKIKSLSINEIKVIYKKLVFVDSSVSDEFRHQLDNNFVEVILNEIEKRSIEFGIINTNHDFSRYKGLKQIIPIEIDEQYKQLINNKIDKIIIEKSTKEFKIELWLLNLVDEVQFELLAQHFKLDTTTDEKRISILQKIALSSQIELIKDYVICFGWSKTFTFIGNYLGKINNLSYYFNFKNEIFNLQFWNDKKGSELLDFIENYANINCTSEELFLLYFEGFTQLFPRDLISKNIQNLDENQYEKILKHSDCGNDFAFEILIAKVNEENIANIHWLYKFAIKHLTAIYFGQFDNKVKEIISEEKYFNFWQQGKGRIFPEYYIRTILNDNYESYKQINSWLHSNITSKEVISNFLLSNIKQRRIVSDRIIFYRIFNHVKFLVELDEKFVEQISEINYDFSEIVLWFLGRLEILNFDLLKQKFIYFSPKDQVTVIKKLFSLIAKGTYDLNIEKLNELTRIDLDLYRTNFKFNPDIPLDISTDVILKALLSYKEKGKFLVESDLLGVVLNNLNSNTKRRFQLENYFENCEGRTTPLFDFEWSTKGKIRKIPFGNNQFYFSINFEYNLDLLEAVKKITGRKWNSEMKIWGVPSKYEVEVLDFAKKYRFFLDFEGGTYTNNVHLAEFKRLETPNGIRFCDGRIANKQHDMFKQEFWWCGKLPCFKNCETSHSEEDWLKYTLLDFVTILKFDIDEHKKNPEDFVPKGHFYQFISLINRFNRLLEKIYCKECDEILYPVRNAHFAVHTTVRFCCENSKCSKHKKEVYLNHCLNGQCNSIIDSRVSKKCPNGLYICCNCGTCCSHRFFEYRLNTLKTADNLDNEQKIWIFNDTKYKFDKKLGHLDRAEYFCHRCANKMEERGVDTFVCSCGNTYETSKYRFQRPHRHLTTEDSNPNSTFEGFDEHPF